MSCRRKEGREDFGKTASHPWKRRDWKMAIGGTKSRCRDCGLSEEKKATSAKKPVDSMEVNLKWKNNPFCFIMFVSIFHHDKMHLHKNYNNQFL